MSAAPPAGAVELLLVRHGESVGNVAATTAQSAGKEVIDVGSRDADVPLTETGTKQAKAFGNWLAELEPADRPESLWCAVPARPSDGGDRPAVGPFGVARTGGRAAAGSASWTW